MTYYFLYGLLLLTITTAGEELGTTITTTGGEFETEDNETNPRDIHYMCSCNGERSKNPIEDFAYYDIFEVMTMCEKYCGCIEEGSLGCPLPLCIRRRDGNLVCNNE